MRKSGQYPHHVCGRLSDEQLATLNAICDVIEDETQLPALKIDGIRRLLDSRAAKALAAKARPR